MTQSDVVLRRSKSDTQGRTIEKTDLDGRESAIKYGKEGLVRVFNSDSESYSLQYAADTKRPIGAVLYNPNGTTRVVRYLYDKKGRIKEVRFGHEVFKLQYNPDGHPNLIQSKKGLSFEISFGNLGRVVQFRQKGVGVISFIRSPNSEIVRDKSTLSVERKLKLLDEIQSIVRLIKPISSIGAVL